MNRNDDKILGLDDLTRRERNTMNRKSRVISGTKLGLTALTTEQLGGVNGGLMAKVTNNETISIGTDRKFAYRGLASLVVDETGY